MVKGDLLNYNFHGLFSLDTNTRYFEGLLHSFRTTSKSHARFNLEFSVDQNLKISTKAKPKVNLMLYWNDDDNSVEFSYPWLAPVRAKLCFGKGESSHIFVCNKNYLRFAEFVGEGWELIDIFRSLLQLSLIESGFCMVHGAVVCIRNDGFLIPSFGNTGKTSTSWMIAKRGGEFLTDELAIIDSHCNCLSFPTDSILSKQLVRATGIRLGRKHRVSLLCRDVKSKLLSTRYAAGGVKVYPESLFRIRERATITRITFIQNGVDSCSNLDCQEALIRLVAIQDYELNWRANPWIIARTFFCPQFNPLDFSAKEERIFQSIVSQVKGSYVVSSSTGAHFATIENISRETSR